MTREPNPDARPWSLGTVDRHAEHFELCADDVRGTLAWVGRGPESVIVEHAPALLAHLRAEVEAELKLYLVELREPDPWQYLKYHAHSTINVYARIQWVHRSGES